MRLIFFYFTFLGLKFSYGVATVQVTLYNIMYGSEKETCQSRSCTLFIQNLSNFVKGNGMRKCTMYMTIFNIYIKPKNMLQQKIKYYVQLKSIKQGRKKDIYPKTMDHTMTDCLKKQKKIRGKKNINILFCRSVGTCDDLSSYQGEEKKILNIYRFTDFQKVKRKEGFFFILFCSFRL